MRISDWSSDVCSSDLAMIDVRDDGDVAERHRGILSKTGLEKLRAHSTLAALQQEGTAFSESCAPCRDDRRVLLKAWGSWLFLGGFRLQLDIVLDAHQPDHVELLFQFVDMIFLAGEERCKEIAADEIAYAVAMDDRVLQDRQRFQFKVEIGLQYLLDGFADPQATEHLEIRKPIEKDRKSVV